MLDLPRGRKIKHYPGLNHKIENRRQDLVGCPIPEPSLIDPFHSSEARSYQRCHPLGPNGHCFVLNWTSVCLAIIMAFSLPFSFISGSRIIRPFLLNPCSSHPPPDGHPIIFHKVSQCNSWANITQDGEPDGLPRLRLVITAIMKDPAFHPMSFISRFLSSVRPSFPPSVSLTTLSDMSRTSTTARRTPRCQNQGHAIKLAS